MTLYLDHAATSYPKPSKVCEAVRRALEETGASPGRGAYRMAREATELVASARRKVADFLGAERPEQVIFTAGATESLNVALKGVLRPGGRAVASNMEHNAVVRPLAGLEAAGVRVERVPCSPRGELDLDFLRRAMEPPPDLVALVHACNVNGALMPVELVGRLCAEHGVPLLVDAAQTAGARPFDLKSSPITLLACSGHKGLLGPPGVGILYIRPGFSLAPLVEGGTGSRSEVEEQPDFLPDRFESGTPNLPGIAGLAAGVEVLEERGASAVLEREVRLAERLEDGLEALPAVRVHRPATRGTGAVAFNVEGMNPGDVGALLDGAFDIAVRTGLHCAPLAHRTLGTFPLGAVRASIGFSTEGEDVERFLEAMGSLVSQKRTRHRRYD